MKETRVSFENEGQKIVGVLHIPENPNPPVIIICHGLSSNKDRPHRVAIAKKFCENGFAVLRFDFRCHGESDGKPEELTYSGAVEDLKAAMDFMKTQNNVNHNKIGVQGTSFGGKASMLAAAEDKRIRVLVTWVAPHIYSEVEKQEIRRIIEEKGYYPYKEDFRLGKIYFDDAYKHDMLATVKKISIPLLMILADKDEIVDITIAKQVYESANEPKKLEILKDSNHWLQEKPENEKRAIDLTVDWFNKWLK